jgi:hypothetical protein
MGFISRAFDDLVTGISRRELTDEIFGEIRRCEKDFANLLSCYDAPPLRETMQNLQQLEDVDFVRQVCSQPGFGEQSKDAQLDQIGKAARYSFEKIFVTLFDRSALDRLLIVSETEITSEAEAEVVRMRQEVHEYESDQRARQQGAAAIEAEPEPVVEDPHDVCVREFHNLGSAAFRAKYLSNQHNRAVYENCVSQGRL